MLGYIGFFDILGYQSFLENNSDNAVEDNVLALITSIEKPAPDFYKKVFPGISGLDVEAETKAVFETIRWLVFSDTIVFSLDAGGDGKDGMLALIVSLGVAGHLTRTMFDNGLPLRGALHLGHFKLSNYSMAGKGVVEAYKLGKLLNLSTCVVSPEVMARGKFLAKNERSLEAYIKERLVSYKTPLSDGRREDRDNLVAQCIDFVDSRDLRDYAHKQFWAHGKDLATEREIAKVEETARFFSFCRIEKDRGRFR